MGTRSLTVVYSGGKHRIAQYGQWDGYPEGGGLVALSFAQERLSTRKGQDRFREAVARCEFLSDEVYETIMGELGLAGKTWVDKEESRRIDQRLPFTSRDHGTKILKLVAESSGPVLLQDSLLFAADSVFCKWAYVIDLDARTFEVFRGRHRDPALGRFKDMPREDDHAPVSLVVMWKLDDLPSKETFLRASKR